MSTPTANAPSEPSSDARDPKPDGWDLEGRTCLVTGATSGIGLETALGLARRGAVVVMAGRDASKAEAARADVVRRSGSERVEVLLSDLGSLAGVRALAEAFALGHGSLHVLVNNAGVVHTRRHVTPDGFEATFAVNHLAPFLLTALLLDLLRSSAPARIVNVSSEAHRFGAIEWDDLQSERAYRGLPIVSGMRVYGRSKLANILFTRELARRLEGSGVTANCLHPGGVATSLGSNNGAFSRVVGLALRPFLLSPAQGAATSLHVASDPSLAGTSGRYFVKQREARPSAAALDDAAAKRLWDESARMVGLHG